MARRAADLPSVHAGDDSHRAYFSPLPSPHAPKPKRLARKKLPHACTNCGARFGEESGLEKHQRKCRYRISLPLLARVPAGSAAGADKPARCPTCDKTFKTRRARDQHRTDKHHGPPAKAAKQGSQTAKRRRPDKATRAARKRSARRELPATDMLAHEAQGRTELNDVDIEARSARDGIAVSWPQISGATRARIDVLDANGLRVRRARVGSESGATRIGKLTQFPHPLTVVVIISGAGGVQLASGRPAIDVHT